MKAVTFFIIMMFSMLAQAAPDSFIYEGYLTSSGSPITDASANLTVVIKLPSNACVLYSKAITGVSITNGYFSVRIDSSPDTWHASLSGSSSANFKKMFQPGTFCTASDAAVGDKRNLFVTYTNGAGTPVFGPISLESVPYATLASVAEDLAPQASVNMNSQRLTNLAAPTASTDAITKTWAENTLVVNASNISGTVANSHLNVGTSNGQILTLDAIGIPAVDGSQITNISSANISGVIPFSKGGTGLSTVPGIGKIMIGNGSGYSLNGLTAGSGVTITSSAGSITIAATGGSGSVTSVATGTGLTGGPITTSGTLAVDVGITVGKIVQVQSGAMLPVLNGNQLTSLNASNISGAVPSSSGGTGLTVSGSSNQLLGMNSAGTGMEYKSIIAGSGVTITSSAGSMTIAAAGGGTLTNVNAGTGLTGGPITTSGTLSVNVGTGVGQIVQVVSGARLPLLDGFLLTGLNPANISSSVPVSKGGTGLSTTPNNGQLLIGNGSGYTLGGLTAGSGISITSSAGTITVATSGTVSGSGSSYNIPAFTNATTLGSSPIYMSGTNVGVGTSNPNQLVHVYGANPRVQIEATASNTALTIYNNSVQQYMTGIMAGNIFSIYDSTQFLPRLSIVPTTGYVGIATTSPGAPLEVSGTIRATQLCDNTGANCKVISSGWSGTGSVTSVAAGTGLTGGPITTSGTLAVDVGTTSGKIVQVQAGGALPALDGFQITGLNPANISGTLSVAKGGTGLPSVTSGGIPYGQGTAAFAVTAGASAPSVLVTQAITNIPAYDKGLNNTFLKGNAAGGVSWQAVSLPTDVSGSLLPANGGTGLSAAGSSNQLLGMNAAGTGMEYKTLVAGSGVTITSAAGSLTISSISGGGGSVTMVNAGTGLLGGPITTSGSLSVDVGTTAGKIVQVASGAKYPAIDGSLITNISAPNIVGVLAVSKGGTGTATGSITGTTALTFTAGGTNQDINLVPSGTGNVVANSLVEGNGFQTGYGSNGAPVYTTFNDTLTGMYFPSMSNIAFATVGTERMRINPGGKVGIGTTSINAFLEINGDLINRGMAAPAIASSGMGRIYFDSTQNKYKVSQNGAAYVDLVAAAPVNPISGTSNFMPFYTSGGTALGNSPIYVSGNNVGIGLTAATYPLTISGDMSLTGKIRLAGTSVFYASGNNIGVGTNANNALTTGTQNTSLGYTALSSNTSGVDNTALGSNSLMYNTTGFSNTAIGSNSLSNFSNTSGVQNIAIGYSAGSSMGSGSYNVILGSNTGSTLSGSNNILLADGQGTERIRIVSSGFVGIGTSTPAATLDVKGHVANTGPALAGFGACGTAPSFISGSNDNRGTINVGTGSVSTCVVNFNSAYPAAPFCVVSWSGSAITTGISSVTATGSLTVNFSAPISGLAFNYHCTQ